MTPKLKKLLRFLKVRKGDMDNLQINLDYDTRPDRLHPVILYTPWMGNTREHFHISLNKCQSRKLRDWLDIYVKTGK